MNSYSYQDNILNIGIHKIEFSHIIRDVKLSGDKLIILLEIPSNDDTINNLYALNNEGVILWQAEDLKEVYNNQRLMPYEQMSIETQEIRVSDFYGRRYFINSDDGKIVKRDIMK